MGKISNFTDSEQMKTPKTDFRYKFNKTKKSISLDSRFVDFENTGLCATLNGSSIRGVGVFSMIILK